MKNLQNLVHWTRIGLIGLFSLGMIAELTLGVMAINKELPLFPNTSYSFKVWMNVIGVVLLFVELFLVRLIYRSRLEYIHLLDSLEEKLKKFSQLVAFGLLVMILTGITALFAYAVTNELIWFFPWMIVLYILGKHFPFKLTMIHELNIVDDEERELFLGKQEE